MKRIALALLVAALLNTNANPGCTHVHDENCGYNPETGEGCTHVCEEEDNDDCGSGIMPLDGGFCAFCPD